MLKLKSRVLKHGMLGCLLMLSISACEAPQSTAPSDAALLPYQSRPIEDDVIYFMLPDRFANGDTANDRGGMEGDALMHGFDPTHKGFYHGGDIKGVIEKLDYLQDLGVSAIWMAPIFKNKPVQYHPGGVSAGYHGYWILDFLDVDPHFGTKADLKRLVDEAHARNMKIILDIVINHSADVIKYEECHDPNQDPRERKDPCAYRAKADYPYTTLGGVDGDAINAGFQGDDVTHQTVENFKKLTNPNYAYTPYIPAGEENAKNPAWLNDPIYYHNRGESHWEGESSLYGDFAGLDDLFTEHPRVVEGFVEIFKYWISEFKVDGFRIDTVRHVNDSFWRAFIPEIQAHAKANGIPEFAIFGEAWSTDPAELARFTHEAAMPSVLDFAFQDRVRQVTSQGAAAEILNTYYAANNGYAAGTKTAFKNPIFLGNHDMGRIGYFLTLDNKDADQSELEARALLGYALMLYGRGVPTLYYGDEQGFTGDGHDQDAREDMFPSQVAVYNDNMSIGGGASPAVDNFDTATPLFQKLKAMTTLRQQHAALRRGSLTTLETSAPETAFAFTRQHGDGQRYLLAINTSDTAQDIQLPGLSGNQFRILDGSADHDFSSTGLSINLEALGYVLAVLE